MRTTRTVMVQGEPVDQAIYLYDVETVEVGGESYLIQAIHVAGALPHVAELQIGQGATILAHIDVNLDARQTVSEATEQGEHTTYSRKDAMRYLRNVPVDLGLALEAEREAAFLEKLND